MSMGNVKRQIEFAGGAIKELSIVENGKVFVNPELVGMSELTAAFCCEMDNEPIVTDVGYVYVSMDWLKKEKPEMAGRLEKLEELVMDNMKNEKGGE